MLSQFSNPAAKLHILIAAVVLLMFILFGAFIIEQVPMTALVGLMTIVAIGTF